jgi:hypothetical protein
MQKGDSVLQWLGLPSEFGIALLVVSFALAVAPYLTGADFGVVKVPALELRIRKRLRWVGPLALLISILLHIPALAKDSSSHLSVEPVRHATDEKGSRDAKPTLAIVKQTQTSSAKVSLPTPRVHSVSLVVSTAMKDASILLDGREPTIINRTDSVIVIEVPATDGNHDIQLSFGSRTCRKVVSIRGNMTVNMC